MAWTQYNVVSNNTVFSNGWRGIFVYSYGADSITQYNEVNWNDVYFNGRDGIYVTSNSYSSYTYYNDVLCNTVYGNTWSGIVINAGYHYTPYLRYNNASHNVVFDNGEHGIWMYAHNSQSYSVYNQYNVVFDNTIYNNTLHGIYFYAHHNSYNAGTYIQNNSVIQHNITSNGQSGIYIYYINSASTQIKYNMVYLNNIDSNGQYGMYIIGGTENTIYHNNFINNNGGGIQAYDGGDSQWDNGYPSGGNYWSDYTGMDMLSGSSQDQPGADSIGDTPYTFSSNQDNYPLMYPWGHPIHTNEYPYVTSYINDPSPTIWVHVTDDSAIDLSSIDLYVNGFNVFSTKNPIADGYNVSYIHGGTFTDGQVVTCRIVVGDFDGNTLDWTWTFSVDMTAPLVDSVSPLDGAENVPLDTTINITFSEIMDHTSAESAFSISPSVNGNFSWNGTTMIFTPDSPLAFNTIYTVTINTGATDIAGNNLVSNYVWSFNTGDTAPPEHSNEDPAIDGYTSDLTPIISVHVTDISGVNVSTIRLYVQTYTVDYDLAPITDGYNVSYWHAAGFSAEEVVVCRIVAEDIYGNTLDFTWNFTVLSSFDITLTTGWNFISLPLVQANTSILTVLSSIEGQWDYVQYYDATDTSDHWKSYDINKPAILNDLWNIDHTMGFWLHVTNDTTLTVYGTPPVNASVQLYAGWNMVGYPAGDDSNYTVADLKADTGATSVEAYNSSAEYGTKVLDDSYVLKKGEAYWVNVPSDIIWTP